MEFRYVAVSLQGKRITGREYADNKDRLIARLSSVNLQVISCKPVTKLTWCTSGKLPINLLIEFSRQMSILLSAGISVSQAFQIILSEHKNKQIHACVKQLDASVQQGCSLAVAMEQCEYAFDKQYIGVILVGEESGQLVSAFEQSFHYLSGKQSLTRKVKQACSYPVIVLIVAICVITLLLIKVIPGFQSLFASFDQELPWVTQFVISISTLLIANWSRLLVGALLAFVGIWGVLQINFVRAFYDKYKLSIPIIGALLKYYFYTSFALSCHNLLKAGVPLHRAIGQLRLSVNNIYWMRNLAAIEQQLTVGMSFHQACQQTNMFPSLFVQLILVGEESGTLDIRLLNLSDIYQSRLDDHINQVVKLIEPVIMLVTGLLIGGLVLVMYLPIFQMSAFL